MQKPGEHTIDFSLTGNGRRSRFRTVLTALTVGLAKRMLSLDALNGVYSETMTATGDIPFVDRVLETMDIHYELAESDRERIPRTGPVMVTASHPFRVIEDIVLGSVMLPVRPDAKIMANHLPTHHRPASIEVFA